MTRRAMRNDYRFSSELSDLVEQAAKLDTLAAREQLLISISRSQDHVWYHLRMHYDWVQDVCLKCGSMRITKPDATVWYKKRGVFQWNPLAPLSQTAFSCKINKKSAFNERNIHVQLSKGASISSCFISRYGE